jgi:hypothetical protein
VESRNPRAVVLVEGESDRVALETLASRLGRDLAGEGVSVLPVGGAHAVGRFLDRYGPSGADLELAGLCDAGEERELARGLERAGLGVGLERDEMETLGFYVCDRDLEDELIRSLGAPAVEEVLAAHGRLGGFRTYQKQLPHRDRAIEDQLRGFLTNWKVLLAGPLVEALDLTSVPRPLDGVISHVEGRPR